MREPGGGVKTWPTNLDGYGFQTQQSHFVRIMPKVGSYLIYVPLPRHPLMGTKLGILLGKCLWGKNIVHSSKKFNRQ